MADPMITTEGGQQSLSTWAGPYVTDMLGKAQAFSELPYQPYTGALTAGESQLQTKAFQGLGALTVPQDLQTAGQQAQQTFGTAQQYMPTVGTIQSYMNPYLEAVLEPQRREATRQADIARQEMQGRMAKAGAYGGSRQAIMEAEAQRNLQTLLGDITGKGYAGAFDVAQKQRQADIASGLQGLQAQTAATQALTQAGGEQARYGLQNIAQQLAAGQTQRDIEQQGLTADYNQYLRELQYPREQLEFQRQMITGLPIASASFYQPAPSAFTAGVGGAQDIVALLKALKIV
jgi:hypothetical protein